MHVRLVRRKLRRLGFETLTQLAQLPRPQVPEAAKELKMAPRRLEKLRPASRESSRVESTGPEKRES